MCFSADASLISSVALVPTGGYCISAALRKNRAYVLLATVPLLFAAQQLCEGGVWIGLQEGRPNLVKPAALGFLFFAVALWPIWLPLSAAKPELRETRRRLFHFCALVGVGFAIFAYLPLAIFGYRWLQVQIVQHSLQYDVAQAPRVLWDLSWLWDVLYLTAACLPFLLASDKDLRALGISIAVAAVVTHFIFRYAFISVWCFFAALLSLQICYVLYRLPNDPRASIKAT